MNGSQLRELRLFKGLDIAGAISLCETATITPAEWAIIESSDAKCPAIIERTFGLIRLPRGPRSYSSSTTSS